MFNFGKPKVPQVSVDEVKKSLEQHEKVILLDVRTTSEFERERIQNSINLLLQKVSSAIESIIPDKEQKIYVYCRSGSRSTFATAELMKKGYKNVFNMEGGLLSWHTNRYPTVS